MANYEATRYDFDAANLQGIQGVNTGIIVPWSSGSIPSGFLECDGSNVSRSTYADLFAVVGTTYGSGDGSTTFGLPNLQERCCQNDSPTKSFASTGGASNVAITGNVSVTLSPTTLDTPTIASHSHPRNIASSVRSVTNSPGRGAIPFSATGSGGGGGAHGHGATANFSGGSRSVLQPYITVVYIIKT